MDDQRLKPTSAQSTASPTTQAEDARGEARCQSTSPQDQQVRMWETPVPVLQPAPARPLTPRVLLSKSQDSGSCSSQMSAPLFMEDRCDTSPEDETAACDAEVTFIYNRRTPSRSATVPFSPERPMSTPMTTNYTTQGDPNQVASPKPPKDQQSNNDTQYVDTNNYFIPDDSDRCIHNIPNKVFHTRYLENGNNAYLLHLQKLQHMLHTSQFLMDEMSSQFYAVYGNTYQRMSTKSMLKEKWAQGELVDQLATTRQAFSYAGLSGSTPCLQHLPPASDGQDDFIWENPTPKTVQYQPPSFSLDRPMTHLTIEEQVQVHHNYISAVSNLEHKKDLINRLKRNNPQNMDAYEAEMW